MPGPIPAPLTPTPHAPPQYNGQHALRERAKKIGEGILVIRFEVPFNVWCLKCNEHIAQGERFNAEKQQVGNYLSTKILAFTMRHHCGCKIVIQTDPKNCEYVCMEGVRRKVETYTAQDAGWDGWREPGSGGGWGWGVQGGIRRRKSPQPAAARRCGPPGLARALRLHKSPRPAA
jgi:coiled-coil domain-containing protein 130